MFAIKRLASSGNDILLSREACRLGSMGARRPDDMLDDAWWCAMIRASEAWISSGDSRIGELAADELFADGGRRLPFDCLTPSTAGRSLRGDKLSGLVNETDDERPELVDTEVDACASSRGGIIRAVGATGV